MDTPQIFSLGLFYQHTTHLFDGFGRSRRCRRFTNKKFNVKKVAAAFLYFHPYTPSVHILHKSEHYYTQTQVFENIFFCGKGTMVIPK